MYIHALYMCIYVCTCTYIAIFATHTWYESERRNLPVHNFWQKLTFLSFLPFDFVIGPPIPEPLKISASADKVIFYMDTFSFGKSTPVVVTLVIDVNFLRKAT